MEHASHASIDETFALLSHDRRRLVLQYFKQYANPIELDTLAGRVARWEQDLGTEPLDQEVERVEQSLHETHLPKFGKTVLVKYDSDSREVRYDGEAIGASLANANNVMDFLWRADQPEGD